MGMILSPSFPNLCPGHRSLALRFSERSGPSGHHQRRHAHARLVRHQGTGSQGGGGRGRIQGDGPGNPGIDCQGSRARHTDVKRIVLAGFSQGGAVSLYTAPRLRTNPGRRHGAVLLLAEGSQLSPPNERRRMTARPIFMAHGQGDPVLPIMLGRSHADFLLQEGYTVEWHEYPMAHCGLSRGNCRYS